MERKQERCFCGALVSGIGEKHLKANLKLHKKSKRHKELIEIKALRDKMMSGKNIKELHRRNKELEDIATDLKYKIRELKGEDWS